MTARHLIANQVMAAIYNPQSLPTPFRDRRKLATLLRQKVENENVVMPHCPITLGVRGQAPFFF